MRRSQHASAPRVGIGRGTDNEVPLADIRLGLHVAALVPRESGMAIEKAGTTLLTVNGANVESATLKPGDEILLGPYRIEILAPPPGSDGAIQIELVQPMGQSLDRLNASARIGLDRTSANKRIYAWTGFVVVVIVCLAVPIVFFSGGHLSPWNKDTANGVVPKIVGLAWNTGAFSNAHRFFAADCKTCHNNGNFTRAQDDACLACHAVVGSHVEHSANLGSLATEVSSMRCTDCHTEHRGFEGTVISKASLCLGCHRGIRENDPAVGIRDVEGWPGDHPQFFATLVADATKKTTIRVQLGTSPPPADHPGIKFSHAAHLLAGGFPALGYKEMTCADCHVAEPSGQLFLPITYKNQCEKCHQMAFDSTALPWEGGKVPHGDDLGVIATVWNYYAGLALKNGTGGGGAPAPSEPSVERRAPGMPGPAAAPAPGAAALPADTQAWVKDKATAALRIVFDDKRGCAYCHYGMGASGAFDTNAILATALPPKAETPHFIAGVSMRTRFLPRAKFDHSRHRGMNCTDCHDAPQSATSNEVLIPGIDTCVKCHGTENASLRSQSTCITCHVFHRSEFGRMRMTAETVQ
jgi:predicted CXXCH cytochrome family protein